MSKPTLFSAAAMVLSLSCTTTAMAYNGDFMEESTNRVIAPPLVFEFDGNHAQALASPRAAPALDDPHPADTASTGQTVHDDAGQATSPKRPDDDFQRYFDQHYRAHPVLNASAHLFFEVD